VNLFLILDNQSKSEKFSFYPYIQTKEDLEFLVLNYLKSFSLNINQVLIIPISTIFNLEIFGKKVNFLSRELDKRDEFLYIYFDNLNFYSNKNISATSFGLSKRSDNFISNRSYFSVNKFTTDIEEVVYLSKSINEVYKSKFRKVVFAGDYFTNPEIPNEFKLNLMTEVLASGFYEVYIDSKNEYPNFINLRNNSSFNLKGVSLEKFAYIITSEKLVELLFESSRSQKYLNLKQNDTYFLNFNPEFKLKLMYKGKELGAGELLLDSDFSGVFIDLRTQNQKKKFLGIESFKKVLNSIEKENDYTSL